jgi:DinB superfamily
VSAPRAADPTTTPQGENDVTSSDYQESLARMRAGLRAWNEICSQLPLAVLEVNPAPGVWSIKQNTFHVADAFEATVQRVQSMLTEASPLLLRFDADEWAAERDYAGRPWSEAIASINHQFEQLLKVIGDLDERALQRTGRQPNIARNYLGLPTDELRLVDLVRFEANHIDEHLTSVRAIVAEHAPDATAP